MSLFLTLRDAAENFFRGDREYVITCHQCRFKQERSFGWDYQRCALCRAYLYDYRNGGFE